MDHGDKFTKVIPKEGITIFANLLHTHLLGRFLVTAHSVNTVIKLIMLGLGLTLEHYRYNTD